MHPPFVAHCPGATAISCTDFFIACTDFKLCSARSDSLLHKCHWSCKPVGETMGNCASDPSDSKAKKKKAQTVASGTTKDKSKVTTKGSKEKKKKKKQKKGEEEDDEVRTTGNRFRGLLV